MLICAFCLLLLFWEHFKWAYNRVTFWFRSVVFAGVMAGITAFFILPNVKEITFLNRVSDTVNKGNGLDERSAQWSAAWEQFLSSPAWGDKLVERALGSYPHNVVLEVLMSTGMLGGVFFFGLLIMAGWKYLQRRSVDQEFTPVYYLFIGYFGFAMFSSALITLVQFWVLLALVVSVIPIRNFGEVIKN
jgi:O-antigen ligase